MVFKKNGKKPLRIKESQGPNLKKLNPPKLTKNSAKMPLE